MSIVPEIKMLTVAVVGLAASLAGNALQGHLYLQQRDALTEARTTLTHSAEATDLAQRAANSCSASITALGTAAAVQAGLATQAREFANKLAGKHAAAADKILSTPPAVPGNDCASAQARVSDMLAARKKGGD
ncbi:hypothetical protein [Comamonas terrigena]|uniref:hypothetical protein n=1 Tax=Comamonas terrigena TaxID=32013 RepID=UPI002447BE5D|nr:hypothetical protein [Comamonas terrigena]MDH0049622.1 hypothetical protein [Comamonas terrigena]MDH0511274.1 hypothetical protein [Comamonas terrigena]MDH1091423.1 hypothetical protein [Comamonas terrigena]